MTLFRKKYLIESNRLDGWDYRTNGFYFVTICVHNMKRILGNIVDQKMHLSKIGRIVEQELLRTEQIRNNVRLDQWVIMPNHVHAIIVINLVKSLDTSDKKL